MARFLSELSEAELADTPANVIVWGDLRGYFPVRLREASDLETARDMAAELNCAQIQIETIYFDGRSELEQYR